MFALRVLKRTGRQGHYIVSTNKYNFFARSASQNAPATAGQSIEESQTHFGYQTINESEKEKKGTK